ncbi:MAG: peptidylprolyl isomerase [Aquificota bacterium]|nr:peptidylprolyl isomerase [Aquificota bacterium]
MVQGGPQTVRGKGLYGKLALILLLLGTAFGEMVDRVVANVNGEPVLESEVRVAQIFYGNPDREEVLRRLIDNHLIAQYLKGQGVNVPEGYLEAVIRDVARSNGKTLDQLYEEIYQEGLTPDDLKSFLRVEITATLGFREFMKGRIRVSELEIELERLRKGEVDYVREVDLLVVPKERKDHVLKAVSEAGLDISRLAERLGVKPERLRVRRGDLVEVLDREIWRAGVGHVAIAEDEENLYLAKILKEHRIYSGRTEEEIREEILRRKLQEERKKLLEKLRREGLVEILRPRGLAVSSPR